MSKNHNHKYQCAVCEFSANTKEYFIYHTNNFHADDPLHCNFCAYTSTSLKEIKRHIKTHKDSHSEHSEHSEHPLRNLQLQLEHFNIAAINEEAKKLLEQARKLHLENDLVKKLNDVVKRISENPYIDTH